jgi:hypothetical protein
MRRNPSGGSLVGVAALGVGGYFLYKYFSTPAPAAAASTGTATVTPSGDVVVPPQAAPTAPAGGFSSGEKDALLRKAAAGDLTAAGQVDALGWTLTADQWNAYRAAGGGGQTTVDLFPVGADRATFVMSAADYLQRRRNAGLTGLGYAYIGAPNNVLLSGLGAWYLGAPDNELFSGLRGLGRMRR